MTVKNQLIKVEEVEVERVIPSLDNMGDREFIAACFQRTETRNVFIEQWSRPKSVHGGYCDEAIGRVVLFDGKLEIKFVLRKDRS